MSESERSAWIVHTPGPTRSDGGCRGRPPQQKSDGLPILLPRAPPACPQARFAPNSGKPTLTRRPVFSRGRVSIRCPFIYNGNGLGFIGADVLRRLVPHVVFDLQANYVSVAELVYGASQTVTGYGLAPTVQFQLKPIGHTPYLGIGMVYVHESLNNVTASATGLLINAGYEWRFASGVGVLVGGGIDDLGKVSATDGTTTIQQPGGVLFNLEIGVRYYF